MNWRPFRPVRSCEPSAQRWPTYRAASSVRIDSGARRGVQFALPFPSSGAAVFRRDSFRRGAGSSTRAAGEACRPLPLAAARDPLRPSTERAVSDRTTSDILCRSTSASARAPPRVRPVRPVFRQAVQLTRRARALQNRHPVRGDGTNDPGRLRWRRCSTLRSSRALRVRCSACALRSAPFRPIQRRHPRHGNAAGSCYPAPARLGLSTSPSRT